MPLVIGQTVGRYRIEEEIGAGGMGVVYRGYDNKLKREIAIKVLAPGMLDDPASRKRFRNEALILSRLNHPSIQTIYDFDTVEKHDLLIAEFFRGLLDTRTRLEPLTEESNPSRPPVVGRIVGRTCCRGPASRPQTGEFASNGG